MHVMSRATATHPTAETASWPDDLPFDLPRCYARLANMAARAVNRHYNAAMRATGLPITQISVLAAVRADRWSSLTALAEELALERTSLLRNLALLERDGFVAPVTARSGAAKRYRLTPAGQEQLALALPHWRRAQDAFTEVLGRERAADIGRALTVLRRAANTLAQAAESAPASIDTPPQETQP